MHQSPRKQDHHLELRTLEIWHDDDSKLLGPDTCQELTDINNTERWSADEMFKYNEKMHKVTSTYNERTLGEKYTTPLSKSSSKTAIKMATQLAREIEKRIIDEGRKTPESSDDDELFEAVRKQQKKVQCPKLHQPSQANQALNLLQQLQKQQKHLNQLKSNQQRQSNHTRLSDNQVNLINNLIAQKNTSKMLSHDLSSPNQNSLNGKHNHRPPSLSTNSTLKHTIIRPVSSSSRNILRSCLA